MGQGSEMELELGRVYEKPKIWGVSPEMLCVWVFVFWEKAMISVQRKEQEEEMDSRMA